MSKLSLREINQSQLDTTPVIDGQLIVCLDTGNTYRDSEVAHVKIGSDLEVVSELPLAPLADKIYLVKPDKLYMYTGGTWVSLNGASTVSLKAAANANTGGVDLALILGDVAKNTISITGKGGATVTEDEGNINVEALDPNQILENLTNEEIDKITGGYVDEGGGGSPLLPITIDTTLTASGFAADAKVTGTRINEVKSAATKNASDIKTIKSDIDTIKTASVVIDKTLKKENFAADAKVVGDALDTKSAVGHNHDDVYYKKTDADTLLSQKSDVGHTHDDRYYTEDETDALVTGKLDVLSKSTATALAAKPNKISPHQLTIPIEGWQTDDTVERYTNYIDIDVDTITANDVVTVNVVPASAKVASCAQFTNPETFNGYIRLRAASVPTSIITAQYYIVEGGGQTENSGTIVDGYTKEQVDNKIAAAIKAAVTEQKLLDHPVGSIYQSTDPTSPADLFGGEWEGIKDRFLLSAGDSYAVESTGGEAEHTLTAEELPINAYQGSIKSLDGSVQFFNADSSGGSWCGDSQFMLAAKRNIAETSGVNNVLNTSNLITGNPISVSNPVGGGSHNNMPPYYTVYTWRRIA